MPQQQGSTKERLSIREPGKYTVVIYNDDFTPMDLVVLILMQIFFMPHEKAYSLMMGIHQGDKARVGEYTFDIAASKASLAIQTARREGYPLRVEVEPVEKSS